MELKGEDGEVVGAGVDTGIADARGEDLTGAWRFVGLGLKGDVFALEEDAVAVIVAVTVADSYNEYASWY